MSRQRAMPQQHVNSPEIIYETLTSNESFMDLVGSRIFEAGNTELSAISIITPGAELPKSKSTLGLEVVIHDVAQIDRRDYISDDSDFITTWRVFLLAWPPADGGSLNEAARLVMNSFTKAVAIETTPLPRGLGAIAQVQVVIPSDSIALTG